MESAALEMLLRWRFTLSLVLSIAAALVMSSLFEWFTAKYAVGLVIVCSAFATLWVGRAEDGGKPLETPQLSKPVEFLSLSFFGVIAGGLITVLIGGTLVATVVATLVLAVCPAIVATWRAVVRQEKTSGRRIVFRTISLLSGWVTVLAVGGQWMSSF